MNVIHSFDPCTVEAKHYSLFLIVKRSQSSSLVDKRRGLEDDQKNLQVVRDQPRDMANGMDSDIKSLDANLAGLMGYWTHARSDALAIRYWLDRGANSAVSYNRNI